MFEEKTYTVIIEYYDSIVTVKEVKQIDHVEPAILTLILTNGNVRVYNFNKIGDYTIIRDE